MAQQRRRTKKASPTISNGTLYCLAEKHHWEPRPNLVTDVAIFGRVGRGGIRVAQQCEHCDSIRARVVARSTGELLYVSYVHSENYRAALDEGITKPEARLRYYQTLEQPDLVA